MIEFEQRGQAMDYYIRIYITVAAFILILQMIVVMKEPTDKLLPITSFLLSSAIAPVCIVLVFPLAAYKAVEQVWSNTLKRHRYRVKRH